MFFQILTLIDAVILATGYAYRVPSFLQPVKELVHWTQDGMYDVQRNYAVDKTENRLFVQNAQLHTHVIIPLILAWVLTAMPSSLTPFSATIISHSKQIPRSSILAYLQK